MYDSHASGGKTHYQEEPFKGLEHGFKLAHPDASDPSTCLGKKENNLNFREKEKKCSLETLTANTDQAKPKE